MSTTPDFRTIAEALRAAGVEFVIIGGVALVLHGSPRVTVDLDLCYARTPENLDALARALAPFHPSLRGAPAGLPFVLDARSLKSGLNFTLSTDAGDVDLLGDVPGLGGYEAVAKAASSMDVYGTPVLVLDLEGLERAKTAAGRLKDLLDLETIRAIRARGGTK